MVDVGEVVGQCLLGWGFRFGGIGRGTGASLFSNCVAFTHVYARQISATADFSVSSHK